MELYRQAFDLVHVQDSGQLVELVSYERASMQRQLLLLQGDPATCGKTVARARCLPCGHTPMQCKTANMSPRALHGLRIHPTSSRTLQNHLKPLRKTQRPFQQHLRTAQRLLHNHNWFNSIHTKSSEYASIQKHCSCIHLLHCFTDPSETSE